MALFPKEFLRSKNFNTIKNTIKTKGREPASLSATGQPSVKEVYQKCRLSPVLPHVILSPDASPAMLPARVGLEVLEKVF